MPLIDPAEEDGARHFSGRLAPERTSACGLLAGGMTSDEACRFAVWWAHNRKAFTTTRQAAWAAWTEARGTPPN